MLSSAVLESRHATLLNYLYGVNGKRSVAVFCAVIRALTYNEQVSADFEPCLIVLSATLEVNGSAQINVDLRTAAELMIALAKEHELTGTSLKYHRKMCLYLGLGEHIKHAENEKQQSAKRPKPTFELLMDQPGELSQRGPRHDNDCENIEDIQILPTMGEILGERAEYLPRSDPSTWHLPGMTGLLDRQFRLIREDTLGQLRDAAKVELNRIHNGNGQGTATRHAGARTYSYRNVRLVGVEFDEHKGLLCALQFDQPRELNIEKRYPRSGDNDVAHVVVQLVNRTEADIETMLFRFGQDDGKLSFSLLEFPGVLLPAFQPTLAALQQMIEGVPDSDEEFRRIEQKR